MDDFEDFCNAKAVAPKTVLKRKLRPHSLYFSQNTLMLTESRGEFGDLHSILRLRGRRYVIGVVTMRSL